MQGYTEWLPGWKARGWRTAAREPVKNQDLWEQLDTAAAGQDIEWHWVKGHSGHEQNEYVGQLANPAIDHLLAGREPPQPPTPLRAQTTGPGDDHNQPL